MVSNSVSRDRRSFSTRLLNSLYARGLWLTSILLVAYMVGAALFGGLVAVTGFTMSGSDDQDQIVTARRYLGVIAIGLEVSAVVAGYASYRLWGVAREALKRNRRRAKGRE